MKYKEKSSEVALAASYLSRLTGTKVGSSNDRWGMKEPPTYQRFTLSIFLCHIQRLFNHLE